MNISSVTNLQQVQASAEKAGVTLPGPIKAADQVFASYEDQDRGQGTQAAKLAHAQKKIRGKRNVVAFATPGNGPVYIAWCNP